MYNGPRADDERYVCTDEPAGLEESIENQTGGFLKPAMTAPGEFFRILFVYVGFENDTVTSAGDWTLGQLPTYARNFADSTVHTMYRSGTMSDYWSEMSYNNYHIIGEVYPAQVTIPFSYRSGSYSAAVSVTIDSLYNKINYAKYDNWAWNGTSWEFKEEAGDGYIDMMIVVFRGAEKDNWGFSGGIAGLGLGSDKAISSSISVGGIFNRLGSGIVVRDGSNINHFGFLGLLNHELGHYLLGYHSSAGGLMTGYYYTSTYVLGAWERYQLGYISYTIADQNNFTTTLGDYVEDGDVLKIPAGYGGTKFYLVENHQRKSIYDFIARGDELAGGYDTTATKGKGIYVWEISGYSATAYGNNGVPPNIELKTGNGAWDWVQNGTISMPSGWPSTMPLSGRVAVNRNTGKSDRHPQNVFYNGSWWEKWHDTIPLVKTDSLRRNVFGIEGQAWNDNYTEIFSPWSAPSTYIDSLYTMAMQVYSQSGENITLKTFNTYASVLALPPAKPQFLQVKKFGTSPKLAWTANIEPDVKAGGSYKIYSKYTTGAEPTTWNHIATISAYTHPDTPVTSWIDPNPYITGQVEDYKLFYKISAVDSTNLESMHSQYDWIYFDLTIQKDGQNETSSVPKTYYLSQNYPNPFNPSTTIQYGIESKGEVSIGLFDILGKEVMTIERTYREPGNYEVQLDASSLSSGVYFYVMKTNGIVLSKKLTILK